MIHVAINGSSARSGGGRSVLRNFLGTVRSRPKKYNYTVFVPRGCGYEEFVSDNISIKTIDSSSSPIALLIFNLHALPKLLQKEKAEVLFNPSDVITPTTLPQVFLFDWPYAAFPESPAWRLSGLKDYLVRRVKYYLFIIFLGRVDLMVAQSQTMKNRLYRLYKIPEIQVVENAVSLENMESKAGKNLLIGEGFKFLCLSVYYTHKNIEIFLPIAREIKKKRLNFKIVITIAAEQHPKAAEFLKAVRKEKLDDVIVNLGPVPMQDVPALFRQCDALLLPTLLESFSGTYVEAMFHGIPIVTSDLDFATGVCRDAAWYFDPGDPDAALSQMIDVSVDGTQRSAKIARGRAILAELPDWHEAVDRFEAMFERVTQKRRGDR